MSRILQNVDTQFQISENCKSEFIKEMKIGYYKEFHKQGLITDEQLELLISMQKITQKGCINNNEVGCSPA